MNQIQSYTKNIQNNFIVSHFFLCMLYMAVLMHSTQYSIQTIYSSSGLIYLAVFLGIFALIPLQKRIFNSNLMFTRKSNKGLSAANFIYIAIILFITLSVFGTIGQKTEFRMLFIVSVIMISLNCQWRYGLMAAAIISIFIFLYDYRAGNLLALYEVDLIIAAFFILIACTVGKIAQNNNLLIKELMWEQTFSKNLLDNLPLAVIVSDASGRIIKLNSTTGKIINLPEKSITGMPESQFWKYAGLDEETFSTPELCNQEINHGNKCLLVNRNKLQIEKDNCAGTVTLLQDITEKRNYEEKMKRVSVLSVVGEMAAGVAHEIKNPLTAIRGFVQLFMQKPEKKINELNEHFKLLLEEINQINKIITDFLQLARPRKPKPAVLNPRSLLQDTLTLTEKEAAFRNVDLKWNAPDCLPEIYGDFDQLKQVILNLVQNAIQACSLGGSVKVTGQAGNDSTVSIAVEDSGHGIADELVEKLFQPFFTTKETGTGLGLPISRRIIEEHGGEIEVNRSDLGGAKFTVKLPIYKSRLNN